MRDRMSRKSIYEDELIWTTLSFFEIEYFRGLWHIATDIGVGIYSVREFKRSIFYYCDNKINNVTHKDIKEGFRRMVKIRRVVIYKDPHGSDKILFWVVNFNKNQRPPKPTPSTLPRPDGSFKYDKDFVPATALKEFDYKAQDALIDTEGIIDTYEAKPEDQKSRKPEKKKTASPQKEKQLSIMQEYMLFFKEYIGIPADDKEWDRQYYKKYVRDATNLIKYLQDAAGKTGTNVLDLAKQSTREIVKSLKNKSLSWSLQGAVMKALPEWKIQYYKRHAQATKYTAARKKEEAERKQLIDESNNPEHKEFVRGLMEDYRKKHPIRSKNNDKK